MGLNEFEDVVDKLERLLVVLESGRDDLEEKGGQRDIQ